MFLVRALAAAFAILSGLSAFTPSHAALVAEPAAFFGSSLAIDMSLLGTVGSIATTPKTISAGGVSTTFSSTAGALDLVKSADFSQSAVAVELPLSSDRLTVSFSAPVSGVAAEVEPADASGAFTSTLFALDANGNLIGTLTASGDVSANGTGSPAFLGGISTTAPISEFYIVSADVSATGVYSVKDNSVVMGSLAVQAIAVPEPGAATILLAALAILTLMLRSRVSATVSPARIARRVR